jgi:hypothetical protein
MKLNKSVEIPESVLLQKVDDEVILLDMNTQEYFSLNEVGALFFEIMQEKKVLREVVVELLSIFDAKEQQLEDDLLSFVASLEQKRLVKLV